MTFEVKDYFMKKYVRILLVIMEIKFVIINIKVTFNDI